MYTHNGRLIQANRAWRSDDGYQHPSNWTKCWGEADLERWSVTFSADAPKLVWDNRFYWGYLNDNETLNPRALADTLWVDEAGEAIIDEKTGEQGVTVGLKNQHIAQKKTEANALLHETDWEVCRAAETDGKAVASATTTARKAVRTACAGIETKITNCSDLDAFIALFATSLDGDGNVVKSDMDCY
jgi:hypothetical protein